MYWPYNRDSYYMKHKLTEPKGKTDKSIFIIGNVNISLKN